jgi:hypothetical protein
MKKKHFFILNIIILGMVMLSMMDAQASIDEKESARIFVQNFYDWYTVLYNEEIPGKKAVPAESTALNKNAEYFDASLRQAIIDDNRAQAKVSGEIVGLDMDPFLAAQDNGFAYQTGTVKQVGDKFFVDIHSDMIGKSRKAILATEVSVIAEVVKVNGHWKFMNFIYPDKNGNSNLRDILKSLRKDRVKSGYEKS